MYDYKIWHEKVPEVCSVIKEHIGKYEKLCG